MPGAVVNAGYAHRDAPLDAIPLALTEMVATVAAR